MTKFVYATTDVMLYAVHAHNVSENRPFSAFSIVYQLNVPCSCLATSFLVHIALPASLIYHRLIIIVYIVFSAQWIYSTTVSAMNTMPRIKLHVIKIQAITQWKFISENIAISYRIEFQIFKFNSLRSLSVQQSLKKAEAMLLI